MSFYIAQGEGHVTNVPTWCNKASTFVEVIGGEYLGGWLWRVRDDVADDPIVDVSEEVFASLAAAMEAALSHARGMEHYSWTHRNGTTHTAEFFSVVTECFFEQPQQLKERHPKLYRFLKEFFREDPAVVKSGG